MYGSFKNHLYVNYLYIWRRLVLEPFRLRLHLGDREATRIKIIKLFDFWRQLYVPQLRLCNNLFNYYI